MSRQQILDAVRAANRPLDVAVKGPSQCQQPRRTGPDLATGFEQRITAVGVTVDRVASWAAVPSAVVKHIRAASLPLSIRHGKDPSIAALPWDAEPSIQRKTGAADASDCVSLSRATAGIAETGTLVLASGPENPVTLAFLTELHIVVLEAAGIVMSIEEALSGAMLHAAAEGAPAGRIPRTINLISGASRTGDIGGRLVMGAHGPRQLVVLLISP